MISLRDEIIMEMRQEEVMTGIHLSNDLITTIAKSVIELLFTTVRLLISLLVPDNLRRLLL